MAVPQRPNLRTSGTGIVACAGLAYCKATSSKTLHDQLTITELSSWLSVCLRQHSPKVLCHKDQNRQPVPHALLPAEVYLNVRPSAAILHRSRLQLPSFRPG